MVNHGLVTAPLFFIVAALAARAGGSEDLRDMGGIAFRAPVLATLFLIVALATLAMPGSSNFVGEFLILLGVFKSKLAIAVIAFSASSARPYYALRMFISSMHNRVGRDVGSREIEWREAVAIVPLVGVILVLAFYPQFVLKRTEPSVESLDRLGAGARRPALERHRRSAAGVDGVRAAEGGERAMIVATKLQHHVVLVHHLHGPHIDWAGLSPFIALTAGALIVLLVGLLRASFVREHVAPLFTLITIGTSAAFEIVHFHHHASIISGALAIDDLALVLDLIFAVAGDRRRAAVVARGRAARSGPRRVPLAAAVQRARDGDPRLRAEPGHAVPRHRAAVDPAVHPVRIGVPPRGLARVGTQVPDDRLGRVGDARLRAGADLRRHRLDRLRGDRRRGLPRASSSAAMLGDPLLLTGLGLVIVGFAFKASVAPFHQWTPDVYEGAPTPITAFMATATKAAALGVFLRFFDVAAIGAQNKWAPMLAALAAITIIVGNVGALGQSSLKRMLGYSGVAQAGYMLGGVVVGTQLGVEATVLYLPFYLAMNLAAFAVIVAVERGSRATATTSPRSPGSARERRGSRGR